MRMWNVNPALLCRQHLLGEHLEMHMFAGALREGHSIEGYRASGLVEPYMIEVRHDRLVEEMVLRGYNHKSPFPEWSYDGDPGEVDVLRSVAELRRRCPKCRARIREALAEFGWDHADCIAPATLQAEHEEIGELEDA